LDAETSRHFAEIIQLAQSVFTQVEYEVDVTPNRAILRIQAEHGKYHILVTELFSDGLRKYSYYVLDGNQVTAGFDNSPDPRAIRLKYGGVGQEHAGEHVPHLHLEDKTLLQLTEEMTFHEFVRWINGNLEV
jgi:hypothetical protein